MNIRIGLVYGAGIYHLIQIAITACLGSYALAMQGEFSNVFFYIALFYGVGSIALLWWSLNSLFKGKVMSEQQPSVWHSELEILFQDLNQATMPAVLFAKKIELQGYLKALINARLIDKEQLTKYANRIEQTINSKLF